MIGAGVRRVPERVARAACLAVILLSAMGLALATARAAYAWVPQKYVDSVSFPAGFMMGTTDSASRTYNKIWHPTPSYFCSHFPPEITSYVCSLYGNPVDDQRSVFNSYAHCLNDDTSYFYPVTCQTNRPS